MATRASESSLSKASPQPVAVLPKRSGVKAKQAPSRARRRSSGEVLVFKVLQIRWKGAPVAGNTSEQRKLPGFASGFAATMGIIAWRKRSR